MTRLHIPLVAALALLPTQLSRAADAGGAPVTLKQDAGNYVLSNGLLTATIDQRTADLTSLHNLELLGGGAGRSDAYWSLPGTTMTFGSNHVASVIADPSTNGGERATVAIQFIYDKGQGTVPADVDIVYSLPRGESKLYLQANWEHKPAYPALTFPVGRFAVKLKPELFNYLATDSQRHRIMPTAADWGAGVAQNMKEARLLTTGQFKGTVEHKYDYAAVQYDTPAYGWAGTNSHIGVWMITPSNEYMSGGCTKVELNAHLDGNQEGYPTLLNVWKGPHYGGTQIYVAPGEEWKKSIGPFVLYLNTANTGEEMDNDANAQAAKEAKAWPYDWVNAPDFYPSREQRSTVSGVIHLNDPQSKQSQFNNLMVGLSAPDWKLRGNGPLVDWQQDGKFYQFWVHGDADGKFTIPNVRPGKYTLHGFATGILGEFAKTDITVESAKPLEMGSLDWQPVRYGTQLWEIGIPDRTAGEFLHGDHFWQWGIYNQYPKDFPHDVHFVIGQSDMHKDWNLMQVPRAHDATGRGRGDATTWTVAFDLPAQMHGKATLRLGFAGTEARGLLVAVNDKPAGALGGFPNTMVIHRDSDRGYWFERALAFDASLMKPGKNILALTVPAGPVTAGIEYDYLRLELDQSAKPPPILTTQPALPNFAPVAPADD